LFIRSVCIRVYLWLWALATNKRPQIYTDKHGLSDTDFDIERYKMEYKEQDFTGLKTLVDSADTIEKVQIELTTGVFTEFMVRRIERKYDGKTFIAFLNPPN